jgi:kynureninase
MGEEPAPFNYTHLMVFESSLEFAKELDKRDALRTFRDRFIIPRTEAGEAIYFLGNSLGLQPKKANTLVGQVLDQWSSYGVEGFFIGSQPWMHYHEQLTKYLSEIAGAFQHEIVVMNQLTVNLHLMLVSFYQPEGKRKKILYESKAFPSDQYLLETHIKQRRLDPDEILIEVQPPEGEDTIRHEDIFRAIEAHKDELALVLWGGVNYYSGQVFDIKAITSAAHQAGAVAGFDLAHAAGNIELKLHEWDVDFACWCSYKYLNSGPGSVGGVYIHERYHKEKNINRLAGWWGYKKEEQFLMRKGFKPEPTAEGWQISTPSPVLFALHKAALELFAEAGMKPIVEKGQLLSDYLLFLLTQLIEKSKDPSIRIITPKGNNEKGCQVSLLMLWNGEKIFDLLTKEGVFADWREPNVIRVAPVPLYNRFEEIWQFVNIIDKALKSQA